MSMRGFGDTLIRPSHTSNPSILRMAIRGEIDRPASNTPLTPEQISLLFSRSGSQEPMYIDGVFGEGPVKKTYNFPDDLPKFSPSLIQSFRDLVKKAKPLNRAMGFLKEAIIAFNRVPSDPENAMLMASRAMILAGRGSASNPNLAGRIAIAARMVAINSLDLVHFRRTPGMTFGAVSRLYRS